MIQTILLKHNHSSKKLKIKLVGQIYLINITHRKIYLIIACRSNIPVKHLTTCRSNIPVKNIPVCQSNIPVQNLTDYRSNIPAQHLTDYRSNILVKHFSSVGQIYLLNISQLTTNKSFLSFIARCRGAIQSQLPIPSTHTLD